MKKVLIAALVSLGFAAHAMADQPQENRSPVGYSDHLFGMDYVEDHFVINNGEAATFPGYADFIRIDLSSATQVQWWATFTGQVNSTATTSATYEHQFSKPVSSPTIVHVSDLHVNATAYITVGGFKEKRHN